ncbi:MAG: hypothetical protein HC869_01435 [Rhodospirillales bacterium]|nr:hypothetical protein [Rhodospirillales bacterium]
MSKKSLLQGMAHIRIFSMPQDWKNAVAFYRDILDLSESYSDPEHGITVYECGGDVTLGVEQVDPTDEEDSAMVGRFTGISFRVSDMASAYADLSKKGVAFDRPPEKMPWGGILAHFRDPAGNTLTLVQDGNDA